VAQLDTPEGEKLDVLMTLIEAYASKHSPMALPERVKAKKSNVIGPGPIVVL
jgi:HTH-type transcriptional regulator/antitoxin HigA